MRFLAILLLLFSVSVVLGQEETPEVPFTPSSEIIEFMDKIEVTTSDIRGLDALKPITRIFPTREDVSEYLRASIREEDEQIYADAAQFYIAFDLLPSGSDLLEIYLMFLESQVAGFYDTDTEEMNVVLITPYRRPDRLPLLEQIIYSHEYIHALQDQHFDLDVLMGETEEQIQFPDRATAVLALIEGDATYVMNEYTVAATQDNPGAAMVEIMAAGMSAGGMSVPAGTPKIIETELLFPYLDGSVFVGRLYEDGGWERVNEAYDNPPQSTEHILHPEKYLEGEMPVEVELSPEVDLGEGWTKLFDRALGEFYLIHYLDTQLESTPARTAAKGWGGDRYRLYYNPENDTRAWVMRLAWDTPEDAQEFINAYTIFGDMRFEDVTMNNEGCWSDADDALCLATLDNGDSLISYAPDLDTALRLLETQKNPIVEQ